MKKAKLILPALLLMMSSMALNAQTSFGIRAGVNFQNLNGKDASGDRLDNKIKTGFHAGVLADIAVAEDFYFQPGLLYSTKGAKGEVLTSDVTINLGYIEMPLNFLYKPVLGTGKLLLGVGPYLAYGVNGKVTEDNGNGELDVKFEKAPDIPAANTVYVKPFDAGANVLVGYEFANRLSAQLNAQLGLANINAYNNDAKIHNTGFGISLGYRFGK